MANSKSSTAAGQPSLANYNAGFYNTLTTALNLDPGNFQLTQGAFALPEVGKQLYNIFDGVPRVSVAQLFEPNSLNKLSGNYASMISYATDEEKQDFIYSIALDSFKDKSTWESGQPGRDPKYDPDLAAIKAALKNGSTARIVYNSKTAKTSLSDTWAKNAEAGGVWFWGFDNQSEAQSMNAAAESSDVTVEMSLTYATVAIQPGGWFYSGYFVQMYQNPALWKGGQNQWNTLFGPAGALKYNANQAIIATDISIKVTSHYAYSESQFNFARSSENINVWPFYTSSKESSTRTEYTKNADNSITTEIRSLPGAVQVIGFNVNPVQYLIDTAPHLFLEIAG